MVDLVPLAQAAQYRDRVLERWLSYVYGLEASLERRVLLDVLAVLIKRGRAHHVQLPARQRRLQHVGGVDRPFRCARAHERVQLVDEDDVPALGARDFLQHRLETLLELATVFRPRDEGPEIEADEMLILERVRHVAVHDPLREPFDDRRLAHARLADQHGIVLGSPRQDLHHAADLFVSPDHRIELALAGLLGEVAGETLERLVLLLRLLVGDPLRTAHALQRCHHVSAIDAHGRKQLLRRRPLLFNKPEQEMLGGDVRVAQPPGFLVGAIQDPGDFARQGRLGGASRLLREPVELALRLRFQPRDVEPRLLEQGHHDPVVLRQQRVEEMGVVDHRVAALARQPARLLQRLSRLDGQSFGSDHSAGPPGNLCAC